MLGSLPRPAVELQVAGHHVAQVWAGAEDPEGGQVPVGQVHRPAGPDEGRQAVDDGLLVAAVVG
jgi:hypothetical protein